MTEFRSLTYFFMIVLSLAGSGCTHQPTTHKLSGWAQGTTYNLTFWADHSLNTKHIEAEISRELERLDASISNYQDTSTISKFNANESVEPIKIDKEIVELYSLAKMVSRKSMGCYDPTIFPAFKAWGFLSEELVIPSKEELEGIRKRVGVANIVLDSPTRLMKTNPKSHLDLSSIGQGYSVKRLAGILESADITNYLVEIGGEMQVRGKKPDGSAWRVAIEKPDKKRQEIMEVIELHNDSPTAIMTSGTYRHYYKKYNTTYSHIIDGRTLEPVKHKTVSVTVIHNDASLADAWSTALLCLGSQEGFRVAEEAHLRAMFIDKSPELTIKKTDEFIAH